MCSVFDADTFSFSMLITNRVKPTRNDGRRLRRFKRRWKVERTNAWLHCYRGVAVRWSHYPFLYVGMVYISFMYMALQRF